jgi:hypothetical protein
VAGTLLDVDHFLDYRLNGHRDLDPKKFVDLCRQYRLPRFFFPLHSYEWIVPYCIWALFFSGTPWVMASALGLILHMALDLKGNGLQPLAYSFIWRVRNFFESRRLVRKLPPEALEYWGTQKAYMRGHPARPRPSGKRPGPRP